MKILLIMPDANIHKIDLNFFQMSFREAPLSLTMLAALVPKELNADIRLVDESVERVDWQDLLDYDLIGISLLTGTSVRGYEMANFFRSKGKIVVLGGVHVTLCPDECTKYADSIVIGNAEKIWPKLLVDYKNNNLKSRYTDNDSPSELLKNLPKPRRDLQKKFSYALPNTVMSSRGCNHICDFCTIPVLHKKYYRRPVADIIKEVSLLKGKRFSFNDVNLTQDLEWSKKLLKGLIPFKKIWGGLSTFDIYKDRELMSLLQKSGCRFLLVGIESISQDSLKNIYKGFNQVTNYNEGMKIFHDHGIIIQGCFVFGLDSDQKDVFKRTVDQVNELKIDIPRYSIYTPYPGTKAYKKLEQENRILTTNYQLYDTQHVVYKPLHMTPGELYSGLKWSYKETFKISSITQRCLRASANIPIAFAGNLAYRRYIKKLYSNKTIQNPCANI